MTIGAAASWALANQCAKEAGKVNALAYVVWASLFSLPPLYLLSLWREGWPAIAAGLGHATLATWAVILWQSVGNTMFGYGVWAWLLARYPAATVSPLTLAGAGLRHRRVGAASGRAAGKLEDLRGTSGDGRTCAQPVLGPAQDRNSRPYRKAARLSLCVPAP